MSSGAQIHPTASVDDRAELGDGVTIGPYAIIGPDVAIDEASSIGAHVVIEGRTRIGRRCRVFSFAVLGSEPQDQKYDGEPTALVVGDNNTIREFTTMNRGTADGAGQTRVGDDNLFMAYAHVAHDCTIGSGVVMANAATLAGHVTIEDLAIVGGLVAIHQHVRIGESAILGGGAMASLDVPPFCMAAGDRARLHGLNLVGLKRRGFSTQTIAALRGAYRTLFQSGLKRAEALATLRREQRDTPEVQQMVRFVESSERGVCR